MEQRIAKVISFIFHPLFIPFYTILFLLNADSYLSFMIPARGKLILSGIVFVTTVFLPLMTGYVLVRMKIVQSLFSRKKEERIFLLLNASIFYYLTYYLLKGTHASVIFNYFMLGATLLVIASLVITFFHMISLHMVAAGGLTGCLLGLAMAHPAGSVGWAILCVFLGGITGTARLILKRENPATIYSGFLVGIAGMFLLFMIA